MPIHNCPNNPVPCVLLMLSDAANPHPVPEINTHTGLAAEHGVTHVITTRKRLGNIELEAGVSVVAFYGNGALGNHLLGYGCFQGLVEGLEFLEGHPVYPPGMHPNNPWGFITLSGVVAAGAGANISFLNGVISNGANAGQPLTVGTLPRSAARIEVRYQSTFHF